MPLCSSLDGGTGQPSILSLVMPTRHKQLVKLPAFSALKSPFPPFISSKDFVLRYFKIMPTVSKSLSLHSPPSASFPVSFLNWWLLYGCQVVIFYFHHSLVGIVLLDRSFPSFSFIHSVVYLYQFRFMDSYFIQWIVVYYYHFLFRCWKFSRTGQ